MDSVEAAIRRRDADFKQMPSHWQAQQDRRFLLRLIDELRRCDAEHWTEDKYGNETRIDCGNGCEY